MIIAPTLVIVAKQVVAMHYVETAKSDKGASSNRLTQLQLLEFRAVYKLIYLYNHVHYCCAQEITL